MKNLGNMLKEAQKLQSRMVEQALEQVVGNRAAGAGMVTVTLNGKGEMRAIKIDPSLAEPGEIEVLEDLIVAAFNDAKTRLEAQLQEEMGKLTGGMSLPPGFKMPF